MTEEQIIKAWEMCSKRRTISDCIGCPYRDIRECLDTMLKDTFAIYHKQKAEIERLRSDLAFREKQLHNLAKENEAMIKDLEGMGVI